MLLTILKHKGRISFLQNCAFLQNRTFADKRIVKQDGQKKKKSNEITLKNFKSHLQTIKNAITPWDLNDNVVPWSDRPPEISKHCDVVVIGGGVIGSSVAFWLKKRFHKHLKVVVVEKDPMYTKASTVLSAGGLRQQFSLQENIEMSLFGAEFLRNINHYLSIDGEPIDSYFHPYGYLMLASEKGAETLSNNSKLQNFLGANNVLMTPSKLKDMFPWISTEDVALGCLGLDKEGWFDPWSLLCALKKKAMYLGVEYVHAEAKGFMYKNLTDDKLDKLIIMTPEGEERTLTFAISVLAAGAASGEVAKLAKVGAADGMLSMQLPVEPRKRYVYCFHCPEGPGINTPLTIDYTGTYFRREGLAGTYICGRSPEESEEPPVTDLSVDYNYFDEKVWPVLAHRVPAFEKLKLKSCWAGYYEYNTFDQNGIIGSHPYHRNLIFATGFSGHGIQQAPAVGRAVSELIIDGTYTTIDLSKLNFNRIIDNLPVREANIV
ncbi:FAD-dependent oxidoreductase domain-containing protein 1 [Lasioglossum baleicum]|uniref:FAD-dependent oxidoreductase domain-containing protein 1 n=1 Tax=Lasioglossum baleicum TaxID=434251 RepID=UPI003FCE2296